MTFPLRPSREWIVLLPAMTLPFLASLVYFKWLSGHWFASLLYALTKLFTLAWPILGGFLFLKAWLPSFKIRDSAHRRAAIPGFIIGTAIVAVMYIGLFTPIGDAVYQSAPTIKAKAEEMGFVRFYIAFAVFLSFFHSLLEEYYWRWFVYGNLRELMPELPASMLAACAFASHHVVILSEYFPLEWALFFGASVAIGGIIWNAMYERQRTLAGAWISHMLVDLGIMGIGYLLIFT